MIQLEKNREMLFSGTIFCWKAALFAPMVTHRRPLSDIASAFSLVEHYEDGVGKLVVV